MRRSPLLGWAVPAVIVLAIAVYVGGVVSGRWRDPTAARGADGITAYPESTDSEQRKARAELCPLINRPEVLELVEQPATVKGLGTSYDLHSDWHQCAVTLPNSVLRLNVWHGRTRIVDYQKLFPEAQPRAVLGRPAIWTTDPSPMMNSTLNSSTLLVACRADAGGMVEITILRQVVEPGDEAALMRIAERQLPALRGWPG
ncbi:hypothetical protein [Micromonospora sp. SL4-19]|uniref:hypothetical protein n=1 Tax=Micromonospora sp. SL4-19 TaxID=3399129 RepID=UPI003A4D9BBE